MSTRKKSNIMLFFGESRASNYYGHLKNDSFNSSGTIRVADTATKDPAESEDSVALHFPSLTLQGTRAYQ